MLKQAYSEYATIQHTIDYYIIILMQKNSTLIAKMGITTLDIDTITSNLLDMNNDTININTLEKNKQNKSQKREKEQPQKDQTQKEQLKEQVTIIEPINVYVNKLKDIHKFLFDLWNKREIDIVINLYKELESKKNTDEQNSLYDNIMNYCSMKETKLNKYIEQNSSVL